MGSVVYRIGDVGGPTRERLLAELLSMRTHGLRNLRNEDMDGVLWLARRLSREAEDRDKIKDLLHRAASRLGGTVAATVEALLGLTTDTEHEGAKKRHAIAAGIYKPAVSRDYFERREARALLSAVISQCLELIGEARLAMHLPVSEWPPVLIVNGWGADSSVRDQKLVQRKPQRGRQRGDHPRLFDD